MLFRSSYSIPVFFFPVFFLLFSFLLSFISFFYFIHSLVCFIFQLFSIAFYVEYSSRIVVACLKNHSFDLHLHSPLRRSFISNLTSTARLSCPVGTSHRKYFSNTLWAISFLFLYLKWNARTNNNAVIHPVSGQFRSYFYKSNRRKSHRVP